LKELIMSNAIITLRHFALGLLVLVAAQLGALSSAQAQTYPARPVRMVVTFPPGASTDVLARILAQSLTERMGATFLIDNRAGASGVIGVEVVAKAPADGHTLLYATQGSLVLLPILVKKLPYDPVKDFLPIAKVADVNLLVAINAKVPATTLKELVALSKSRPGGLRFSSAGIGSINHLVMEFFAQRTGIEVTHIPYKGGAPATLAAIAGEVDMFGGSRTLLLKPIEAGQLRGIGVAQPRRSQFLPNVPTMSELGIADMNVSAWYGVVAPAAVPAPVAARLSQTIVEIASTPEYQKMLNANGGEGMPIGGAAFASFVNAEMASWRQVIGKAGIQLDQY
jgi:tripartite-type tricarboxylate transporter receptor subunit TctC